MRLETAISGLLALAVFAGRSYPTATPLTVSAGQVTFQWATPSNGHTR